MMQNRCCLMNMKRCQYDTEKNILICKDFPLIYGDTETKHHYIYKLHSLKQAFIQYKELLNKFPYYGFMYDGHSGYTNEAPSPAPKDSFENIVGILKNIKIDDKLKVVYGDFVIFADTPKGKVYKQLIDSCSPIGVSVVLQIDSNSIENLSRNEAKSKGYRTLEDMYPELIKLKRLNLSNYITVADVVSIDRVDLVNEPAFETYSCATVNSSLSFKFRPNTNVKPIVNKFDNFQTDSLKILNSNNYSLEVKTLIVKLNKLLADKEFRKLLEMLTHPKYDDIYNSHKDGIEKVEYFSQYKRELDRLFEQYKEQVKEILKILDSSGISELDIENLKTMLVKQVENSNRYELFKQADFIVSLNNFKQLLKFIENNGKQINNPKLLNKLANKYIRVKRLLKTL